ncbi:Arginyl-tRNA synthetase [Mortierella sp. AD031]|nr:Arginyl-tRNA synthetase [Mortierella sp. AD031]
MAESTLVSFRRAIATHLAGIVGQSVESLVPLVQQNTSHRKASHSVFSVVIKRLQSTCNSNISGSNIKNRGNAILDEQTLDRCCSELSKETRQWIVKAQRTRDMLLFDPQPLQLVRRAVGAIYRDLEGEAGGDDDAVGDKSEDGDAVEVLRKRTREETCSRRKRRVIVDGAMTLQDENVFCSLRRTVLTGFVARFLGGVGGNLDGEGSSSVKVIADHACDEFLKGLDIETRSQRSSELEGSGEYLETVRKAFQTDSEIKARITEDGAWVVDLTAHKLGQVKVYSSSSRISKDDDGNSERREMGDPTAVIETLVAMARRFETFAREDKGEEEEGEGEGAGLRYVWIVPDGRRLFAEQVLYLARIIFPGWRRHNGDATTGAEVKEEEGPKKKRRETMDSSGTTTSGSTSSSSWADSVEVVYYGPAAGVDLPKDPSVLGSGDVSGLVEYTNVKMRDIVTENRGGGGENDGEDDEDDRMGDGLDEAELLRMSQILSRSALVVSCCGSKRVRKLNISLSRILDGKGNSGVFLQYVLSRLYGIERKSKTRLNPKADLSNLEQYQESFDLALVLADWPDILSGLGESLDPYLLVSYLFNLAAQVGQANRVLRVKGMDPEVAEARWLLFWAAKQVVEQGLRVLGLESLERM